jgi:hypothetical protein
MIYGTCWYIDGIHSYWLIHDHGTWYGVDVHGMYICWYMVDTWYGTGTCWCMVDALGWYRFWCMVDALVMVQVDDLVHG